MTMNATCRCSHLDRTRRGPFHVQGGLDAAMKPADAFAPSDHTRFPAVHGAPVHIGKPELMHQGHRQPDWATRWRCTTTRSRCSGRAGAPSRWCDCEAGVLHHALPRSMLVTESPNTESRSCE